MWRFIAAVLIACGSGGEGPSLEPDASVDAGPLDLATASWENAPIGDRPDTTALRPDLAITESGEVVVVWVDVLDLDADHAPVFAASSATGFAEEIVTPSGPEGFSRPSVSAAGDRVHLVFSGPGQNTGEDIFYSRREAGSFTAPVNITGPIDSESRLDHSATVVEAGGVVTALFLSAATSLDPDGLYAVSFSDPGDPATIETILDPSEFNCRDVEAVTDGATVHAVAACSGPEGSGLFYFNDRSGQLVRQTVELGASTGPFTPDIALDADGGVHLLWVGSVDCPAGSCRDVFHSRGLAPPTSVTGQSEDGGFMPVLAVDDLGRVVVAFHRLGNVDDVLWTYAESGGGFVRTQLATPGTVGTTEWQPGGMAFHPLTGRPHMAFLRSASGNSDILHGELR